MSQRPASLDEVIAVSVGAFGMACDEFCDAFYLDYPDKARMQAHLDPAPPLSGDPERDARIGAIGEHLALRWALEVPRWTARAGHFALRSPVYMPPSRALQSLLIAESPPAFRSRLDLHKGPNHWKGRAFPVMSNGFACPGTTGRRNR